jgi:NADH:ubiquinone oxidoreductase subunit
VGHDRFGNEYYEQRHGQSQRSRWVAYADKRDYSANSVPPEWFGWLHATNDCPPVGEYEHPFYETLPPADEEKVHLDRPLSSYEPAVYAPKGYPKPTVQKNRWSVEVIQRWQGGARE